jgi:hypothetical protein
MNKAIVFTLVIALTLPASAMAQWLFFGFNLTGTIMDSPAQYTGPLTWGAEGTFAFTLDDSGWPDPSDQAARWDYIFNTYFAGNYDNSTPGAYNWKGYIDGWYALDLTSAPPGFNGSIAGELYSEITLRDQDGDGIYDPFEREGDLNSINGTFTIACDSGTGELWQRRGGGAMQNNGISFAFLPAIDDMPEGSGNINVEDCPVGTESSSWGRVKALYR